MWHATIGRGAWTALIAGFGLVLTAVAVDANDEGYVERMCLGQGSTRSAWSGRHRGPSTATHRRSKWNAELIVAGRNRPQVVSATFRPEVTPNASRRVHSCANRDGADLAESGAKIVDEHRMPTTTWPPAVTEPAVGAASDWSIEPSW